MLPEPFQKREIYLSGKRLNRIMNKKREAFARLGKENDLHDNIREALVKFTCALFAPDNRSSTFGELRGGYSAKSR